MGKMHVVLSIWMLRGAVIKQEEFREFLFIH